jgi:DNA-binding MarR family transcriptional regulator
MSSLTLTEFADKVADIMPAISREFLRHQTAEFYKLKITLPQCVILDMLNKNGELNMSDLARIMNVTTAAMTGIVERLVRDGYVARISDPGDRRVIKIKLTAKGSKVVKTVHDQKREMTIKLFGVLSEHDRNTYLDILTRVQESLKG